MSAPEPIFKPDANATPVSEIAAQKEDPRRVRVHRLHGEIARGVKDGSLYRSGKKKRFS